MGIKPPRRTIREKNAPLGVHFFVVRGNYQKSLRLRLNTTPLPSRDATAMPAYREMPASAVLEDFTVPRVPPEDPPLPLLPPPEDGTV